MRIAHVAFEFGLRDECRYRVDHDDVDRIGAYEHLGDIERLFAGIRLRDEETIEIDAEVAGIDGVECMLDIDESGGAAHLLRFCDDVKCERRFTARLRTINLDDATAR